MTRRNTPESAGEPVESIRLKWRAVSSPTNTYTEWFEETDNNLDIIHEIKQKLEGSLGKGESFVLETDDGFTSRDASDQALSRIQSEFCRKNKIPRRAASAPFDENDDVIVDKEEAVGFIRLRWKAAKKPATTTQWFENTPHNLQMISSIRRALEGSLGHGNSFTYEFDDGFEARFAARDMLANLPQKTPKGETEPPSASNDP